MPLHEEEVKEQVLTFLNTISWPEKRAMLEGEEQALLLTDEADQYLNPLVERLQQSDDPGALLKKKISPLAFCHCDGFEPLIILWPWPGSSKHLVLKARIRVLVCLNTIFLYGQAVEEPGRDGTAKLAMLLH